MTLPAGASSSLLVSGQRALPLPRALLVKALRKKPFWLTGSFLVIWPAARFVILSFRSLAALVSGVHLRQEQSPVPLLYHTLLPTNKQPLGWLHCCL